MPFLRALSKIGADQRQMLSCVHELSDDDLLHDLRSFEIVIDKTELNEICKRVFSVEELSASLIGERTAQRIEQADRDCIRLCLTELWSRWCADKPCVELLELSIRRGYDQLQPQDSADACRTWLDAWNIALALFDKAKIKSMAKFDKRFRTSPSLSDWVQDLDFYLLRAGHENNDFLRFRISLCEEMLKKLQFNRSGRNQDDTTGNWKKALAQSYFLVGETDTTDSLYAGWLEKDPLWGEGWIGWSDCYFFNDCNSTYLSRSEEILLHGFSFKGVRGLMDLLIRLTLTFEKQGKNEKALMLQKIISRKAST